jgi:hypothetical protein
MGEGGHFDKTLTGDVLDQIQQMHADVIHHAALFEILAPGYTGADGGCAFQ